MFLVVGDHENAEKYSYDRGYWLQIGNCALEKKIEPEHSPQYTNPIIDKPRRNDSQTAKPECYDLVRLAARGVRIVEIPHDYSFEGEDCVE